MFVAGPYTGAYGGTDLGVIERGFELELTSSADPIVGDNMGDAVQDEVYTGGNCFVNFTLQEYNHTTLLPVFWPFHATPGCMGLVGRMKWDLVPSPGLVLSAVNGTRAYNTAANYNGPVTITFGKAILAADHTIRLLYAARHRQIPIRMRAFPYYGSSYPTPIANGSTAAAATLFVVV
jgi:hypothetical protein